MKLKNFLPVLLLFAFLSSALGQRETFSQRRQRLLDEKRRQRELDMTTTNRPITSTTPKRVSMKGRSTQAPHKVVISDEVEFRAKMSNYLNWEQFLTPVPKSLGIVATLLLVAGQTDDFPLNYNNRTPSGGFQYMQHPSSFRQTLLQVSQDSYEAFLTAHNNMNKIRLSMKTIPDYLKVAVGALTAGNMKLVQEKLQPPLEIIRTSITDNLIWSSEMVDRFDRLANLTDEIHLAAMSSTKDRMDRKTELIAQQENRKLIVENIEQLINSLDQSFNKDISQHFRTVDDLVEAYKSMPTAIDSFFMDAAQVFEDVLGIILEVIKGSNRDHSPQENTQNNNSTEEVSKPPPDPCLYEHHSSIFALFARSQTLFNQYTELKSINSALGVYNATKDMNEFTILMTNANQCKPIKTVIEMGNNTIQMIHQLADVKEMPSIANEKLSHIEPKERFLTWRQYDFVRIRKFMEEFNLEAKNLKDIATVIPKTDLTNTTVKHSGKQSRKSKQAKVNAEYKIAVHTESLKVISEAVDRNLKLTIKKTEESISMLNQMYAWKAEEMTMDRAIEMLKTGTIEMVELKKTWSRLVTFFAKISNLIEVMSDKRLEDFNKKMKTIVDSRSFKESGKIKKLVIKVLRENILKASQASTIIYNIATTYYRISKDYLMPRIQEMDTKMRFDSTFDIDKERILLVNSLAEDEFKISQLFNEEMQHLIKRVEERERQIKKELALLDKIEE